MQSEKDVNQLDTGLTALPCPITTPMNLTFKFQIKACNNIFCLKSFDTFPRTPVFKKLSQ